jgi:hypothetical protein
VDFQTVLSAARAAALELRETWDERMEVILRYCTQSPGWAAFPGYGRKKADPGDLDNMRAYLAVYLERYFRARQERLGLKEVSTVADPAVDVILRVFAGLSENLDTVALHHRRSMAAENLLGELLERYLAERLETRDWVWCAGNTARAVDFLRNDLSVVLQVKNRSNSENSSSSAIRKGTEIIKWYRVNASNGKTNWENFPLATRGDDFSEDDFHAYIEAYAKRS